MHTFIVEAISTHYALIDTENMATRNSVSVSFIGEISDPHVL